MYDISHIFNILLNLHCTYCYVLLHVILSGTICMGNHMDESAIWIVCMATGKLHEVKPSAIGTGVSSIFFPKLHSHIHVITY